LKDLAVTSQSQQNDPLSRTALGQTNTGYPSNSSAAPINSSGPIDSAFTAELKDPDGATHASILHTTSNTNPSLNLIPSHQLYDTKTNFSPCMIPPLRPRDGVPGRYERAVCRTCKSDNRACSETSRGTRGRYEYALASRLPVVADSDSDSEFYTSGSSSELNELVSSDSEPKEQKRRLKGKNKMVNKKQKSADATFGSTGPRKESTRSKDDRNREGISGSNTAPTSHQGGGRSQGDVDSEGSKYFVQVLKMNRNQYRTLRKRLRTAEKRPKPQRSIKSSSTTREDDPAN
jgi:hypothetical protein